MYTRRNCSTVTPEDACRKRGIIFSADLCSEGRFWGPLAIGEKCLNIFGKIVFDSVATENNNCN
jgi:hypothetical protein